MIDREGYDLITDYSALIINILGLLLSRGAILPIINMCSMTLTLTFVMCCVAVVVLRRRSAEPAEFQVPGGMITIATGGIGALVMAVVACAPRRRR